MYEGAAGAAMMFLKLWESKYELPDRTDPLERAAEYIDLAVKLVEHKNKQTQHVHLWKSFIRECTSLMRVILQWQHWRDIVHSG